jgi:hypothetical protein
VSNNCATLQRAREGDSARVNRLTRVRSMSSAVRCLCSQQVGQWRRRCEKRCQGGTVSWKVSRRKVVRLQALCASMMTTPCRVRLGIVSVSLIEATSVSLIPPRPIRSRNWPPQSCRLQPRLRRRKKATHSHNIQYTTIPARITSEDQLKMPSQANAARAGTSRCQRDVMFRNRTGAGAVRRASETQRHDVHREV